MKKIFCLLVCILCGGVALFCYSPHIKRGKAQAQKTVYLTFDDGPTDSTTPAVLDVLSSKGVCATFFVIGRQAELRPTLLQREKNEGHVVAVHSYTHEYAQIYASTQALAEDIEKCHGVICSILGDCPKLYRFPGGSGMVNESFHRMVKEMGYTAVNWTASLGDADNINATAEKLYRNAIRSSADQDEIILLCHDFAFRHATVQALPRVIDYYAAHGYAFRTL